MIPYKLKKKINKLLESEKKLSKIKNKYLNETVLIVGDGVSQVYYSEKFKNYDYVICSNNSISNKYLANSNLLYWICMEPYFCSPKIITDRINERLFSNQELARINFDNLKNIPAIIMHPTSRFTFHQYWLKKKPIFISPYHKLLLNRKFIYNDFSASLQASIGMALLSGFRNLHIVGYDAWLLEPKNNVRWLSKIDNFKNYDYSHKDSINNKEYSFLTIASKFIDISVITYLHYDLRFKNFKKIHISNDLNYSPSKNRKEYMTEKSYIKWNEYETNFFKNGYGAQFKA